MAIALCGVFWGVSVASADVVVSEPRLVLNSPDFDYPVAWSSDGARIAFTQGYMVGAPSKIGVAYPDVPVYQIIREGISEEPFAWSPDGTQIAFNQRTVDGDSLGVVESDGSFPRHVFGSDSGVGGFTQGIGWTADGRLLYYGRLGEFGPQVASVVPAIGGESVPLATSQVPPTLSPDGLKMGVVDPTGVPRIVDLLTPDAGLPLLLPPGTHVESAPQWSADGSRIVWLAGVYDSDGVYWSQVWAANADEFMQPLLVAALPRRVWSASLSQHGDYIAIDAEDASGLGSSVSVLAFTGGTPVTLDGMHAGPWRPLWSPTADRLAVFNGDALYTIDVSGAASTDAPHTSLLIDAWGEWQQWIHYTGTISFVPDRPGVPYYQWDSTDPSGWKVGSTPLYALQGLHTLYYYTEGASGVSEPIQSRVVGIDGVPPSAPVVTQHAENADRSYTVSWTPSDDADSGVDHYEIWDGGTWKGQTYGTSITIPALDPARSHLMYLVAKDHVGNGIASDKWTYTPGGQQGSATLDFGIRLDFASLTSGAATGTAARIAEAGRVALPAGFAVLGGGYYDIATTTSFSGEVTVTVPYDESALGGSSEADVRLYHFEGGQWRDVTVPGSVDTVANTVAGKTTSFSPFAVVAPLGAVPELSTPASSGWSLPAAVVIAFCVAAVARRRRAARA